MKHVSTHAKDLITSLMKKDPKERISCKEALKHPWFQEQNIFNRNK
jgi:serine/threonine protein kinase